MKSGRFLAALAGFLASNAIAAPPVTNAPGSNPPGTGEVRQAPVPRWAVASEPMPLPSDPAGAAFVRAQDMQIHLTGDGQSTFVSQRIVLLQPQALAVGNLGLAWNPASGAPQVHALRIHRGGETIDVLRQTRFEIIRREDQLEQATITGTLTAVLKVPDLRVGDELEFSYTLPSSDPTLRDRSAGLMMLTGTTLPGRYHLGLSWEPGQEPRTAISNDFPQPAVRSASAIDIRADNPSIITPPKDAPPRYGWQRLLEFTDYAGWADVSRQFAGLFAGAAKLREGSPLKAEAARIAAANSGTAERAAAALKLVQQQVRYVYVGLEGGNYRPASADETWQRRYGDCKGKTALLLALLAELGISAEPVLVRNEGSDDGYDARLPNPGLFDHVLVRAMIGGQPQWLDGTLPAVATPAAQPDFPYRWVLPLTATGQSLEQIAWQPARKPNSLNLYEIDMTKGIDEPATIRMTSISRGPAALKEYVTYSVATPDQMLQAFRGNLTGNSQWNSVDKVSYRFDQSERASILTIEGTGPIDWDRDAKDNTRSLALPGGGFNPPDRRQRASDQDQAAPFYKEPDFSCYVTTVRLPAGAKPGNWSASEGFDNMIYGRIYYRALDLRDGSVRLIRGSRVEQTEIDAAKAARDNGRLAQFDNSMAWLYFDPAGKNTAPWSDVPVRATYEGDWLHDSSACLPVDVHSK